MEVYAPRIVRDFTDPCFLDCNPDGRSRAFDFIARDAADYSGVIRSKVFGGLELSADLHVKLKNER